MKPKSLLKVSLLDVNFEKLTSLYRLLARVGIAYHFVDDSALA